MSCLACSSIALFALTSPYLLCNILTYSADNILLRSLSISLGIDLTEFLVAYLNCGHGKVNVVFHIFYRVDDLDYI